MMRIALRTTAASLAVLLASIALAQAGAPREQSSSSGWRPLFDGHSLDGWEHVGPGQVRDRGWSAAQRGRHGAALVRQGKTRQLRDPRGLQDRHRPLELGRLYSHRRTSPRTSGTRSTTASRCKSWTTAVPIVAPGRSIRSPRRPRSRASRASGTRWRSRSRATTSPPRSMASRLPEFDSSSLDPQAADRSGEGDPARGPRPESGYIGLQNHDKNSVVYFKEVSVRPLSSESQ